MQRTKKESMQRSQDHPVSEFTHAGSPIDSISLSIAELLKDVKDNKDVPYINKDGTLNVNFVENTDTLSMSPLMNQIIKPFTVRRNSSITIFILRANTKIEDSLQEALGSRSTNPSQNPQEVSSVNNSIAEDTEIFNQ